MDHDHGDEAEVMVVGDEGPEGEPAPEERAVELVDELRALLMQLTGGEVVEDPMEEGAFGKKIGGALGSYAAGKLGGGEIAAAVGEKAGSYLGDKLTGDDDDEDEEAVEEGGSGRADPVRRPAGDRRRPDRTRPMQEAQVRQLVRTALKRVMEKKNG